MFLRRRHLIATTGLAAASLGLPRIAIGQADRRPSITIAVQQIANSASLEPLREQSNVGERVLLTSVWEGLLGRDYGRELQTIPVLATGSRRNSRASVRSTAPQGRAPERGRAAGVTAVVLMRTPRGGW